MNKLEMQNSQLSANFLWIITPPPPSLKRKIFQDIAIQWFLKVLKDCVFKVNYKVNKTISIEK